MIKYVIFLMFFALINCTTSAQSKNLKIFKDKKSNEVVSNSIKILQKESNSGDVFYVLQNRDSLIILKSSETNINKPLLYIEKVGCYPFKKNNIVITKPFKAKHDVLQTTRLLPNCTPTIVNYNDNFEKQSISGIIYQVTKNKMDSNFSKIFEGDVSLIFQSKEKNKYGNKPIILLPEPKHQK